MTLAVLGYDLIISSSYNFSYNYYSDRYYESFFHVGKLLQIEIHILCVERDLLIPLWMILLMFLLIILLLLPLTSFRYRVGLLQCSLLRLYNQCLV